MLKRVFISSFITVAAIVGGLGAWRTAAGGGLSWLGAALAGLWAAGYFARLYIAPIARTRAWMPALLGPVSLGAGLAATGGPTWPLWASLVVLLGTVAYVRWYSRLPRPPAAVAVGQPLPAFTLEDPAGGAVPSSSLRGRPHILLFFRGNWCPLCMAQIREVAEAYQAIEARGAQVVLVSPQRHDKTEALAARFEAPMTFLVDRDLGAARALGIAHADGTPLGLEVLGYAADTVLPTLILVDAAGLVVAVDQTDNYRIRPEPADLLALLDRHALTS